MKRDSVWSIWSQEGKLKFLDERNLREVRTSQHFNRIPCRCHSGWKYLYMFTLIGVEILPPAHHTDSREVRCNSQNFQFVSKVDNQTVGLDL